MGDGITDDSAAIQAAIDSAPDPAVVSLPAGVYRIEDEIELDSRVVLRGEGYLQTHIDCFNAGGCFRLQGDRTGGFVDILSGLQTGSTVMVARAMASVSVAM